MPIKAISLSFCLALISCASQPPVQLAVKTEQLPLMQPIAPARRIVQQVSAQWQKRQESMVVVLELDAQHIAMSGLTPEGLGLFNLNYDGKRVVADKSPLLPAAIAPEYMLTDLQFVYWPVSELQKLLPKNWRLVNTVKKRSLYKDNQLIVEVNYLSVESPWSKNVDLYNTQFNYRLHIKTLSYEALP